VTKELSFIYTAAKAGAPLEATDEAILEPGLGIVGDRYYRGKGTFSEKLKGQADSELTLIEAEEIDAFNRDAGLSIGYGEVRRNFVTTGVRLNDLVGRRFRVGECVLEGMRLCEPCAYLASTVAKEVLPRLVHKAGLRARIVKGGTAQIGDSIVALKNK
jgi:MOSC domain-containing protein YiiM